MNNEITAPTSVTAEMLDGLPDPVQRYLRFSGVVGKPWIETVRLEQRGTFRTGPDKPWMPVTAEELYTTDPPTLTWHARFKLFGLPLLRAKDRYENGQGHMYGKLAGLITVFDVHGQEINQATMVRYLNEIMWFPTAFLANYISWEAVDDSSARVTFSDGGKSVSARMFFDGDGRLTNFVAHRYREISGEFSYDRWATPILEYGQLAGYNLPVRGRAIWNLESGDMPYADLEIVQVSYNHER